MRLPYKIGYAVTMVWLVWIVYGYMNYDSITDRDLLPIVLWSAVLGIIILPIYFISVLLYYVYKRAQNKE
ncbi:hypothetical protein [Paenibacillus glucanolyticus]|uniref:hypothetical protein n=1 Tax=Paenibacillus glucanolyticus TaxID=59843 RepID=UPI001180DAAD|nr:hypothetical protein [Paenibacillus glucanolyticus]MPY17058.1 hypothetical protein [Paenibacillus glucanolyticus]